MSTLCRFTVRDASYTLDLERITVDQAIEAETATGRTWDQLLLAFRDGSALAVKALYWLARRQAGEQITFDSPVLTFAWGEYRLEFLPRPGQDATPAGEEAPDPTEGPRSASATS